MKKCKPAIPRVLSYLYSTMIVIVMSSCASQALFIDTHAKRDEVGNYIIQWETSPVTDGVVDIFVSDNPYRFPDKPMMTETIASRMVRYDSPFDGVRRFFLLVFNRKDIAITAARMHKTDSGINMRDIGGYATAAGLPVKWGMVVRSGALLDLSPRDSLLVHNLQLRSRIILSDVVNKPELYGDIQTLPTCVVPTTLDYNYHKRLLGILTERTTPEAVKEMQVEYLTDLAFKNKNQYSEVLHRLLDPTVYPVLISDGLGKDRVGFLVMVIQSILGVSHNDIIREYLQSNEGLSASRMVPSGHIYPNEIQESLTEYYRCRESDLNAVMGLLTKQYGSIAKYAEAVLDFDAAKQRQLRKLLLLDSTVAPTHRK